MDGLSQDELRSQVRSFLKDFKELMGQGRYYVLDHEKTKQTLIQLGLNYRQLDELIHSLELEDYSSGPTPDQYKPGIYWVFGKNLEEIEIYIKLKIVTYRNGDEQAICISFHRSERSLKYPLRAKS